MKRWLIALSISLLLHSFFLLIPYDRSVGEAPANTIKVTLKTSGADSKGERSKGNSGGEIKKSEAQNSENVSQTKDQVKKTVENKQEISVKKKTVVKEDKIKPTIKKKVIKKKTVKKPIKKSEVKVPKVKKQTLPKKPTPPSPEKSEMKKASVTSKKGNNTKINREESGDKGTGKGIAQNNSTAKGSSTGGNSKSKGNGYVLSEKDVKILKKVTPSYPLISRKRKEEGTVTLLLVVNKGKVSQVNVEISSGYDRLDRSAIKALKGWRFASSLSSTVRIPVIFSLKK